MGRACTFDAGHRVMNERMKCFNVHGHTYLCELTFKFEEMEEIGYAIDFKEIKRVHLAWIDDILDHAMILNPKDKDLIDVTKKLGSKMWLMSLAGQGKYCNPTVENICKEVFLAMQIISDTLYGDLPTGLEIFHVKINETPNCWAHCNKHSISEAESDNFYKANEDNISSYARAKGIVEYDDRKL